MHAYDGISDQEYRRRIRAWTLYDWANSAFATTILAAVLPIYYSRVAGSSLPSAAIATAYWTAGLSLALFIVALISPILGTISDIKRGKKRFLAIFTGAGIVGTGLLVLVGSGDWLLASLFFIIGRVGFGGANIFYDALLPHVAREEDQDRVSTRGYAMGYLGGGILLAINAAMIMALGDEAGARVSFLSVAVWWGLFSIPLLRRVPEPPAATARLAPGQTLISAGFQRLGETLRNLRRYRQLFRFLIAFLIYNDGIGTIIGVAAIYGTELGFGATELILALLLVQFVGIPFSLMFGRIPDPAERRRPVFLAFVLFNMVAMPIAGIGAARLLAADVSGRPGPAFETQGRHVGEGEYGVDDPAVELIGPWEILTADEAGTGARHSYARTSEIGAVYRMAYNGREVELRYGTGPDHGIWTVLVDGVAVEDDDGDPLTIDAYSSRLRYEETEVIDPGTAGLHILEVVNTGTSAPESSGTVVSLADSEVLPPVREAALPTILGLLLVVQLAGLALAWLLGDRLLGRVARSLTTKRTILVALAVYAVIAVWGFFLDAVVEFWFLAWMVAVVQGGSQALSRSLYASMSPTAESGEFFGFFSIMSKFSAIFGPLIFAGAVAAFGSSRPAVLSVIAFFIVGGAVLARVDVDEGRRVARAEDARLLGGPDEEPPP